MGGCAWEAFVVVGMQEVGIDYFVLSCVVMLKVVWKMRVFLAKQGDIAVEGCRQVEILAFQSLNRSDFFLMDLYWVFELQRLVEERDAAIFVRNYYFFTLHRNSVTLLAMYVNYESCTFDVATFSPTRMSHLLIVMSLLTEYSSFSFCSFNDPTLFVCPFKIKHFLAFPTSHTLIVLSSPQERILD